VLFRRTDNPVNKHLPPRRENDLTIWQQTCPVVVGPTVRRCKMERERDWRELCGAVATEHDSKKLIALLQELTEALDIDLARSGRGSTRANYGWSLNS